MDKITVNYKYFGSIDLLYYEDYYEQLNKKVIGIYLALHSNVYIS